MSDVKKNLFDAQRRLRESREIVAKREAELEKEKDALRNLPHVALEVTDHAIVQFMGRALNMTARIYADMLNMCDKVDYEEQKRPDGKQYVYRSDGPNDTEVTFIVKNNSIVTCYITKKDKKES